MAVVAVGTEAGKNTARRIDKAPAPKLIELAFTAATPKGNLPFTLLTPPTVPANVPYCDGKYTLAGAQVAHQLLAALSTKYQLGDTLPAEVSVTLTVVGIDGHPLIGGGKVAPTLKVKLTVTPAAAPTPCPPASAVVVPLR